MLVRADSPDGYRVGEIVEEDERFLRYAGHRTNDDAPVVLQTPRAARPTERDVARLTHELAVLTRLAGGPVAVPLGMKESGGRPWLVLERPAGQPLDRIAARYRSPARAVAMGASIARALAEVHRRGVVHRDLKPAHVLVLEDGTIQLTGLGSASLVRVDGSVARMQGSLGLPGSIVRYVERTGEPVLLEDACVDATFGADPHVVEARARSVLCLPILVHSDLVGLLYLDNNLLAAAFSADRVALLEVVSTQLAISLDNARLYEERQERAEETAREEATATTAFLERSRLATLFEQAPAAILLLEGAEHTIALANPPYVRLVGERPLLGLRVRDAVPEGVAQGYLAILDRTFQSGERYEGHEAPFEVVRAAGGGLETLYLDFIYQPYRDLAGVVQGIMVFGFDVTDRVVARAERQTLIQRELDSRRDAEAANRAKDEFLAMLGHELRNPLAPIVTALRLLELRDGDRNQRERSIIERQVAHLVRLVDDLLDVSRIASGKVELRREPTEMATVVARAIELASPLLEERRHELAVSVARDGLAVDADVTRLSQVVSNLLANAAKYTEPGGRITIVAGRVDETVELRVRDTGIGIAPATLPRVFDLFAQEAQALSRSRGGLGLGLAIVRNLVHLHGGTVSVASEGIGHGTEVTVRLPAVESPALAPLDALPPTAGSPELSPPSGRSVLVVDDNEDAAEMLAEAIGHWGYQVRVAFDGPTALALATEFAPDVALLDIGLPVMDGYELARLLKQAPGLGATRLVALTGYGQEGDRRRSEEAGFEAHLVKPVSLHTLQTMLAEWATKTV